MQLCDVNVLIYAHREEMTDHAFYRSWLQVALEAPTAFLYCELVLSAFARIVTHRKIFRQPTPILTALAFAEQVRSSPNAIGIMPGARHWRIFHDLCTTASATGSLVPDAYLAALAIEADAEWVTTDKDFKVFEPRLKLSMLKP